MSREGGSSSPLQVRTAPQGMLANQQMLSLSISPQKGLRHSPPLHITLQWARCWATPVSVVHQHRSAHPSAPALIVAFLV